MIEEKKLDELLRKRRLEPVSSDLAARIISRAQQIPQVENLSFWLSLRRIFAEFSLPKPAYVLTGALLVGMAAGFSAMPDFSALHDTSSPSAQNLMFGDEALL
jgi:hypothetical protein